MKYKVELTGWDFDTSHVIESNSYAKAKGEYIKRLIKGFSEYYPKNTFFKHLSCKKVQP